MPEKRRPSMFNEASQEWTVKGSLILISISLLLFGGVYLLVRTGLLQRFFAHVVLLAIPGLALWWGVKCYAYLADSRPRASHGPRARNWGPLIASIVIGLTIMLGLLAMFSHQTVRALDAISASEDDSDD